MNDMKLSYFTNDESFPLFVQFGAHDVPLFVHGHEDFYELVTVLDGSAEHIVDGERSVISKGDVFVIGNGISHGFDNTHGLRVCNIMYRPEMLFSGDMDIRKIPGFHALFLLEPYYSSTQHFQSRLRLTHADFALVMPLLERAESEYTSDSRAAACRDTLPAVRLPGQATGDLRNGGRGGVHGNSLCRSGADKRGHRAFALLAAALYPAVLVGVRNDPAALPAGRPYTSRDVNASRQRAIGY